MTRGPKNEVGQFARRTGAIAGRGRTFIICCATAAIGALACESSTAPAPTPWLTVVSGDGQTGQTGTTLFFPIVVTVTDTSGHNAIPNQTVTFTVASGGGSVSPKTAVTDGRGRAQTGWTLGPQGGAQSLTVSIGNGPPIHTVSATAKFPKLEIVGDPSYYFYGLTQSLGLGQYTNAWVGPVKAVALQTPVVVSFSHGGLAYTKVPASVTIQAGDAFSEFRVTGTSIGVDSVVASAPEYSPVSMPFTVDSGTIRFGLQPDSVTPKVGVANEVYVCISPGLSATPLTFALAADQNIRFTTEDTIPVVITSATLPADQSCTFFMAQGLAAGPAQITIANPNYRTYSSTITVKP